MTFADIFKKKYKSNCYCNNCQTYQEVEIPKGITVAQFIEGNTGKCGNCGCNVLVAGYRQIDEFKKPRQAPMPAIRPSNRPRNSMPAPRPEPIEDDTIFKNDIKELDWMGKPPKQRRRYENY